MGALDSIVGVVKDAMTPMPDRLDEIEASARELAESTDAQVRATALQALATTELAREVRGLRDAVGGIAAAESARP